MDTAVIVLIAAAIFAFGILPAVIVVFLARRILKTFSEEKDLKKKHPWSCF